jgi:hypothetical protein
MFEQATVRTGIRYGVIGGISSFLVILILYGTGGDPYGQLSLLSYLPIPFFILAGVNYYKHYQQDKLGFGRAFAVAFSVTLYMALTTALLLYSFAVLAGPEVIGRHVAEMRVLMEDSREQAIRLVGEESFEQAYADLANKTPAQIGNEDFIRRVFFGFFAALFVSIFKRK